MFTTAFRPFKGGSEIAIEEIVKRLPEIDFDIITPRYTRKLSRDEDLGNMRIHRVGFGFLSDKFLFPMLGFLRARQLLNARDYKIIHAYQASYGAGAAWLLKLFNHSLKFVLTLQEGKNLEGQNSLIKFLRKVIIRKAYLITVISNYLKIYARKINKKADIYLIPNGVDIDNFSKDYSYGELSATADSMGVRPGEKIIISTSRLVAKNGLDVLIKAVAVLIADHSRANAKLLLLGDGELKLELEKLAETLNIRERVIFAGSVNHSDLPQFLKISDVFVRPSRSEGLGSAFLEAMAAGTPVIGTRIGGIPDFLKDKETGLFAKVDNPEDISEKINLILNNKDLREKIIKNGRELIVRNYNWAKIAAEFKNIYSDGGN